MSRLNVFGFFNRNLKSYGVEFNSTIEELAIDGSKQSCPSCLQSTMSYCSQQGIGKKVSPFINATVFATVNFLCGNEECGQISSIIIEVDTDDEHHTIWPINEKEKTELLIHLETKGEGWLYRLHEELNFMDYSARIIATFPEDFFPERVFLSNARGAVSETYLITGKEVECERLSIWVKSLATKVRAKDDSFFSSSRKLLEFFLPIVGGFKKKKGENLSNLVVKFRKFGPFKTDKLLFVGPDTVLKKTLSDSLSENIRNLISNTDPKRVDGAVRRTIHNELFEKTLSLNDDLESIEHKVNVHKAHVILEQLKGILNNHTHENGVPKDEDFIVACGLLNDFFCLTEKILAKHNSDKEDNK